MTNEKEAVNTIDYNKMNVGQWLLRIVQGALIGIGCILPGLSGGILCVLFGIYGPMMTFLAHPKSAFKKYYKFLIAIAVGFVLGFFGLAKLLDAVITAYEAITSCLFAGLVLGMMPSLFRTAGKKGRTKASWISAVISFAVMLPAFYLLSRSTGSENAAGNSHLLQSLPEILQFALCGVVWGASLIFPGVSAASLLIILGLYDSMVSGLSAFNWIVILPMVFGTAFTALIAAKFVHRLIERHYSIVYHIIMGMVTASLLLIIPFEFKNSTDLIIGIIFGIIGCAAAVLLDIWGEKIKAKKNIQ